MAVVTFSKFFLLSLLLLMSPAWAVKKKKSTSEIRELKKTVNELTRKVKRLEQTRPIVVRAIKQTHALHQKQTLHPHLPQAHNLPAGYIPIPGTMSGIRIGGYVRVDAFHDFGPTVGDTMAPRLLPLRGTYESKSRTGFNRMHARFTQLAVSGISPTPYGDLKLEIKVDFAGSFTAGTTSVSDLGVSRNELNSNGYEPRLYFAYADWCGFRVGQAYTLLFDEPSYGYPLDFQGPTATSQLRRTLIHYSHPIKHFKITGGIENGITEYVDQNNITYANNSALSQNISSSDHIRGFQNLPDVVLAAIYNDNKKMHFAVRGVLRQLTIKSGDQPTQRKIGHGIVVSTRLKTNDAGSNFHGQILGGRGIGMYIDEIPGYAMLHSSTTLFTRLLYSWGYNLGYRHFWTPKWSSDFSLSEVRIRLPHYFFNTISTDPGTLGSTINVSKRFTQILANIVFNPIEKVDLGLEWGYMRRETNTARKGWGNRLLFLARYRFA